MCAEWSLGKSADVEHSEKLPSGDERNAQHRLDSLLPQKGVGHRRRVNPVEGHWVQVGGYPASKSSPQRHPNPLADLLLDAAGRSHDQLAGICVKKQYGCCVTGKDVQDAIQQRREQVVDIQMMERCVHNRLDLSQTILCRGKLRGHCRFITLNGDAIGHYCKRSEL